MDQMKSLVITLFCSSISKVTRFECETVLYRFKTAYLILVTKKNLESRHLPGAAIKKSKKRLFTSQIARTVFYRQVL